MSSLFLGAYWGSRQESRQDCAHKISNFLTGISRVDQSFSKWFKLGMSRAKANSEIGLLEDAVFKVLKTNNRDIDKTPIVELGFSFNAWNGKDANISIHIGAYDSPMPNSVVLRPSGSESEGTWRQLCELAVSVFDPDELVVTSHDYIERHGGGMPTEAGGWFTYRRGGSLLQHDYDS